MPGSYLDNNFVYKCCHHKTKILILISNSESDLEDLKCCIFKYLRSSFSLATVLSFDYHSTSIFNIYSMAILDRDNDHYTVYIDHYTVYIDHYTVYIDLYTVYIDLYTVYLDLYTLSIV